MKHRGDYVTLEAGETRKMTQILKELEKNAGCIPKNSKVWYDES